MKKSARLDDLKELFARSSTIWSLAKKFEAQYSSWDVE